MPYLDFNARAGVPGEDFVDLSHLTSAGGVVREAEFAGELGRLYQDGVLPVDKP